MKEKDLLILSHLRKDSRMALTEMSKITKIPVSTIFDKIKQQETEIIQKYTSIIDFEKLGYNSKTMMIIRVSYDMRMLLKEFLETQDNINNFYIINSGYDFMIETIFRNQKETENFIEELQRNFEILELLRYNIIEGVNRENFLTKVTK